MGQQASAKIIRKEFRRALEDELALQDGRLQVLALRVLKGSFLTRLRWLFFGLPNK